MQKRLLIFIIMFLFTLVLSGCAKYSTTIEITENDAVILTQSNLMDLELYKTFDTEFDSNNPFKNWNNIFDKRTEDDYINKDFQVRNIADDKYIGKEFTKRYKNAKFFFNNNLPLGYTIAEESDLPIIVKKSSFGATYLIHLKFNPKKVKDRSKNIFTKKEYSQLSNSPLEQQNTELDDADNPKEEMPSEVADLTIKIPTEASKHNATSVDSATNTYIWKLSETKEYQNNENIDIILEYKTVNYVSIVISILIFFITMIVVIKNRKFNKANQDSTKNAF